MFFSGFVAKCVAKWRIFVSLIYIQLFSLQYNHKKEQAHLSNIGRKKRRLAGIHSMGDNYRMS